MNLADSPLTIRRGKHVANFHRQDRDMYDVRECAFDDIDVSTATSTPHLTAAVDTSGGAEGGLRGGIGRQTQAASAAC